MLLANSVLVCPCSEMILFSLCASVTVVSSVLRAVHQRDIDEKLLSGFDIELFINVRIVIFQSALFDVRRFQNLLCGQPRNIAVKNLALGFGKVRDSFKEKSI